jgi:hypothetical protein
MRNLFLSIFNLEEDQSPIFFPFSSLIALFSKHQAYPDVKHPEAISQWYLILPIQASLRPPPGSEAGL